MVLRNHQPSDPQRSSLRLTSARCALQALSVALWLTVLALIPAVLAQSSHYLDLHILYSTVIAVLSAPAAIARRTLLARTTRIAVASAGPAIVLGLAQHSFDLLVPIPHPSVIIGALGALNVASALRLVNSQCVSAAVILASAVAGVWIGSRVVEEVWQTSTARTDYLGRLARRGGSAGVNLGRIADKGRRALVWLLLAACECFGDGESEYLAPVCTEADPNLCSASSGQPHATSLRRLSHQLADSVLFFGAKCTSGAKAG